MNRREALIMLGETGLGFVFLSTAVALAPTAISVLASLEPVRLWSDSIKKAVETLGEKYAWLSEDSGVSGLLSTLEAITAPGMTEAQITQAGDWLIQQLGIESIQTAGRDLEAERALGADRVVTINKSAIYEVTVDWEKAATHDNQGIAKGRRLLNLFTDEARLKVPGREGRSFGLFMDSIARGGVITVILDHPFMRALSMEERDLKASRTWVHELQHYGQFWMGEPLVHTPELRAAEEGVEEPFIFLSRK